MNEDSENNYNKDITLICLKVGGKLRVRITSKGYKNNANCRFPRKIRKEGMQYSVKAHNITLIKRGNSYFYSVNYNSSENEAIFKDDIKNMIEKVYNTDDDCTECCICLDVEKNSVFNPCGHYVTCGDCAKELENCPICRSVVLSVIGFDELK